MLGDTPKMSLTETDKYSPGTARRLRQKLNCLFGRGGTGDNNNLSTVIETDYLSAISDGDQDNDLRHRGICSTQESMSFYLKDYSYLEEAVDEEKWQSVSTLLREHLRQETIKLQLDLFMPNTMLERISKDVVRMSCCEPCGVRGCTLIVNLQKKSSCHLVKLGKFECDPNVVSTFELHLTLIEDKKRWYSFKDLIAPVLPGCLNESHALEVFISPGFRLVKNKLYRPN